MPEHNVLGIDPSLTGTGLVVLGFDGKVLAEKEVGTKPNTALIERFRAIVYASAGFIKNHKPELVVIEQPPFGRVVGASAFERNCLFGVLLWELNERNLFMRPPRVVMPTELKKWASGKGNSKKEDLKLAVFKRWGVDYQGKSNNLCDAHCLARFGIAQLKGELK